MEQENNNNGKTAGAAGSMQTIEETDNDVFLTDEELTNRILERIDELENNGPAGLLEIIVISSFTNKPIRIKFLNNTKYLIGYDQDNESQASLHLNYQEPTSNGGSSGHWYIEDFESDTENDRNNCLFKSVGCQISQRASELRYATIRELRENIPEVVRFIRDFEEEEDEDIFTYMLGGARYLNKIIPFETFASHKFSKNCNFIICSILFRLKGTQAAHRPLALPAESSTTRKVNETT